MIPLIRNRWPMIVLLLSLGANMFLGGFILGHRPPPFGPPPPPGGPPPDPARMVERVASQLAPEDAAILRRALNANRSLFEDELRRRHEFPNRLRAALKAEPFDPKALLAVFEENDREEAQLRERIAAALVGAAAAMSPEGRRRMAEFRPQEQDR